MTTFVNIQDDVLRRIGLSNDADARLYIKRAASEVDRDVWWAHGWHDKRTTAFVNTVAPYDTGTVTVNLNSATVTGAGTTFTSDMVGRKFALSMDDPYYVIKTFGSTTSLTLDRAYLEPNVAANTYTIYQDIYSLADMDALVANEMILMKAGYDYPLEDATSQSWSNLGHMPRSESAPSTFRLYEDDGTTTRIQLWPVPDGAYALRYTYFRRITQMDLNTSVSSNPEERRDLIVIGTTAKGYHYNDDVDSALKYEALFDRRLKQAISRERRLHPQSVILRPFTQPATRPGRTGRFYWRP